MSAIRAGSDEMRSITVLFADIVGSTGLGERLRPDEVKAVVGECVSRMARAVEEVGGTIQAYMGDGICAYFGVPVAHEDDPERAARAALRIIRVASEYAVEVEHGWGIERFDVRVGVNSGPVAVGIVGESFEQTVALGDTTNVAARLQAATAPGTIAVGEAAARRMAHHFLLEPIEPVVVKGRKDPVSVSKLIGARSITEPRPTTPIVGRARELAKLDEVSGELAAGRGQVLLILGEAGLGKSRMLSELRMRVGDGVTWMEEACVSYGADVPYGPFVAILRMWLGVEEDDPVFAVRAKLRARAGLALKDPELLPSLALLLGIRLDDEAERRLLPLSADQLSDATRSAYGAWIESLAADRPLVVAIDDLQWIDRAGRELTQALFACTDRSPVLIVLTMRPDPASLAWEVRSRASSEFAHRTTEIPLTPLDEEASRQLVDGFLPPGVLGQRARDQIVRRAEGNPLFLEELLRTMLEVGGDASTETWTISPISVTELPPALEALLVAKIDRLPAASKQLAQAAAVIGRSFPVDVLRSVLGSELTDEGLPLLLRSGIVRELRRYPELECTFGHVLVQEAALSTLTPTALRHLNGAVGRALEERAGSAFEDAAEQLAFHYYRSDTPERALRCLEVAAGSAPDPTQALALLGRAARLAARVGDDDAAARVAQQVHALGGDEPLPPVPEA